MCMLSPSDDAPRDPKIAAALGDAIIALTRFADLGNDVANGATRRSFSDSNADAAIARVIGEATRHFYELRLAIISAAMGERCTLSPNPETVKVELQRRITRNEAKPAARPTPYSIVMYSADANLAEAARARGAAVADILPSYGEVA